MKRAIKECRNCKWRTRIWILGRIWTWTELNDSRRSNDLYEKYNGKIRRTPSGLRIIMLRWAFSKESRLNQLDKITFHIYISGRYWKINLLCLILRGRGGEYNNEWITGWVENNSWILIGSNLWDKIITTPFLHI